ncbi:MAG: reverse transcriptase-like protein [Candidatus Aenigmarchaeota archaeon]|nr:reverse transcriptase-like protein [Candidatus Aenigmarchaeota archaeon]
MNIHTDGSGKTGRYAYVVEKEGVIKIFQKRGITHNEAEYMAVIVALTENNAKEINIFSDSELIVKQLNRNYKIKEKRMLDLALRVQKLCEGRSVTFTWIPRERNLAGKVLG